MYKLIINNSVLGFDDTSFKCGDKLGPNNGWNSGGQLFKTSQEARLKAIELGYGSNNEGKTWYIEPQ